MSSFELIAQELLKQQQHMERLDAENRELRQLLADLRAGHGIFVEIAGQRFPLEGTTLLPQPITLSPEVQEDLPTPRTTRSLYEAPAPAVMPDEAIVTEDKEAEESIPAIESLSSEAPLVERGEKEESEQEAPTFLEEIMLDEFAAAWATFPAPTRTTGTGAVPINRRALPRTDVPVPGSVLPASVPLPTR